MPRYSSRFVDRVLAALLARLARRRAPWLVGISGAQASGKSTLAAQLVAHAEACGIPALVVELDAGRVPRRLRRGRTSGESYTLSSR
jgi:D-glycerate 3-kinase